MGAALPIGTVKVWRFGPGDVRKVVKVSHHGGKWQRWTPTNDRLSPKDRLARTLSNPKTAQKRLRNQANAVRQSTPKSNRERARHRNRRVVSRGRWYPVIHGPVQVEKPLATKAELITVPGQIVMMPFTTKHRAAKWAAENGYPTAEIVRGAAIVDENQFGKRAFDGYIPEIPDEGQAWTQERTKKRMGVNLGEYADK